MITIVDYGLGNLQAIANIYRRLGLTFSIAKEPREFSQTTRLILPGVGAFDWAMQRLEASGLRPILDDLVLDHQVPVLGICVGMQIMASRSDEGHLPGLGWIPGEVKRFDESRLSLKASLPHMGWNDVALRSHPLFSGIINSRFYFLHSYCFVPESDDYILAEAEYGQRFSASVSRNHIMGVQFHPEKSHHSGVQLLKNFAVENL